MSDPKNPYDGWTRAELLQALRTAKLELRQHADDRRYIERQEQAISAARWIMLGLLLWAMLATMAAVGAHR